MMLVFCLIRSNVFSVRDLARKKKFLPLQVCGGKKLRVFCSLARQTQKYYQRE